MANLVDRVEGLMARMNAQFLSGDMAGLVSHFDFPLAMHEQNRLVILSIPQDLIYYYQDLLDLRESNGLRGIRSRVIALDLPRRNRFRAWVQYSHSDADGRETSTSDAIFYVRQGTGGFIIEMVQVTDLLMRELREWRARNRLRR